MPGLTREQSNVILSQAFPRYQPELEKKPLGQRFEDVYEIEQVEPAAAWQGI